MAANMAESQASFRVGARDSRLSMVQTQNALAQLQSVLPALTFELSPRSSPGDQDLQTDLRASAPDFFTRHLDDALRDGSIDIAMHSAKDLPTPFPDDLDWFWLPWAEDARDAIAMRPGESVDDLPERPVIGVSSDRREDYARQRFPTAEQRSIRGNIEQRLAQLDNGDYDLLLIAAAALNRLDLPERITEWIPLVDLRPPPGQGYLATTFRRGDCRVEAWRGLFLKPVVFAGGGPGAPELCTVGAVEALRHCDVCFYDALVAERLLAELPPTAEAAYVGKRGGAYSVAKEDLEYMLQDHCRRGRRVVRLKGGDPGIFGRLAQETAALDNLRLPYRVIPGVSSLTAATSGTGFFPTRRGVNRGFCVATPGPLGDDDATGFEQRDTLPLALFMAGGKVPAVVEQLLADNWAADVPAAMVFAAGSPDERILAAPLSGIAAAVEQEETSLPGLLLVGPTANADFQFSRDSLPLGGRRILLTCGAQLQARTAAAVRDLGGIPLEFPLIRLTPNPDAADYLEQLDNFDWVVLTSPSAARCFLQLLGWAGIDLRQVPAILSCGPAVSRVLNDCGLAADAAPEDEFSANAMLEVATQHIEPGSRVLRLRSDQASRTVEEELTAAGAVVVDCVLYHNSEIEPDSLPAFDAVFFASASAVRSFLRQWGAAALADATVLAIGEPTACALDEAGRPPDLISPIAGGPESIAALAAQFVTQRILAL